VQADLTPEDLEAPLVSLSNLKALKIRQIERFTAEVWRRGGC